MRYESHYPIYDSEPQRYNRQYPFILKAITLMSLPSVTIPTTSFNQVAFIQQAIVSAVEQDYDNLQVIVCDDASTDGTQDILKELALQYPQRLQIHFNEENIGGGRNRIKSLSLADGELVCYLDGDDLYLPRKINKQVAFMLDRPDIAISYHDVEVFDSATDEIQYSWKDRFGSGDGDVSKMVRYGNNLCSLSVMLRARHMPELRYYEGIKVGHDWIILFQTLMNGGQKFGYLDEVLARHRRHSKNLTLNWLDKIESQLFTLQLIQEAYPGYKSFVRSRRAELYLMLTLHQISRNRINEAIRSFTKCLVQASPAFWRLLRLPLREIRFWFLHRDKSDVLMKSLLEAKAD
jgi:glycosyltransferase involved in cell wall biosynthesis